MYIIRHIYITSYHIYHIDHISDCPNLVPACGPPIPGSHPASTSDFCDAIQTALQPGALSHPGSWRSFGTAWLA